MAANWRSGISKADVPDDLDRVRFMADRLDQIADGNHDGRSEFNSMHRIIIGFMLIVLSLLRLRKSKT